MADSSSYILRSDDGQLYRVTKEQLASHKVGPNDPAHQKAAQLKELHDKAKKAVAPVTADLICFFCLRETGAPAKK